MHLKTGMTLIAAAAMAWQPAFADPPQQGPLAPGKAAGIEKAQDGPDIDRLGVVAAVGLGAIAVYLIVGTTYNGASHKSSTSGTH